MITIDNQFESSCQRFQITQPFFIFFLQYFDITGYYDHWVQETSSAHLFRFVIKRIIFMNIRQPARYVDTMEALAQFQDGRLITVHRKFWRKRLAKSITNSSSLAFTSGRIITATFTVTQCLRVLFRWKIMKKPQEGIKHSNAGSSWELLKRLTMMVCRIVPKKSILLSPQMEAYFFLC